MDRVDCAVFEDQLDALARDELPEAGMAQLMSHAAECRGCAALLRIQEHLASPSLAALEEQVPDAWVASMHADVQRALEARANRPRPRFGWAVPVLAAASVALLVANGVTLRALGRAQFREQDLVEQVLDQQRRLVAAEDAAPTGTRSTFAVRGGAFRSLETGRDLTAAELRVILRGLPAATPVMSASRTKALASSRLVPATWREALSGLADRGQVTAADLLRVLDRMDLPDGTSLPTARLLELLS